MIILHEGTNKMVINQITAFISVDDKGDEGVIGQKLGGTWMPFVCADEERVKSLLPIAKQLKKSGVNFRIVKFTSREDVTDKYGIQ